MKRSMVLILFGVIVLACVAWVVGMSRRSQGPQDQSLLLDEVKRLREPGPYEAFEWIDSVAYSNDGTSVAASYNENIEIWKTQTPADESVHKLIGHGDRVWDIEFSPNDKYIASTSEDQTVRLWDTTDAKEIRQFAGVDRAPRAVTFSPDGTLLAAAIFRKVLIWNVDSGEIVRAIDDWGGGTGAYQSVVFSPDGATLWASAEGADFSVQAWSTETGEAVAPPVNPSPRESGMLNRSDDGSRIVTGRQQRIECWNATSGEKMWSFRPHNAMNHDDIAISHDGSKAAHISQFLQMWEVETGEEMGRFKIPRVIMTVADFSPDGSHIVTGADDGSVRIWKVPSQ